MIGEAVLVLHLRPARRRARGTALLEAQTLLAGLEAQPMDGGPMSGQGGVFWLSLPEKNLEAAAGRLPRLAYSSAVDGLAPAARVSQANRVRWRGVDFEMRPLWREDPQEARAAAPDRRPFAVEVEGRIKEIRGDRGDGGALSRRGLPAYDARVLVNLVWSPGAKVLLDPFAGIGGIALEAAAAGLEATTADNDAWLRHGLVRMTGGRHVVADTRELPLRDGAIDAVATEPPFDAQADDAVAQGLWEIGRSLRRGGRCSMLCARRQAGLVSCGAEAAGLSLLHREDIDRKGTACTLFLWEKP